MLVMYLKYVVDLIIIDPHENITACFSFKQTFIKQDVAFQTSETSQLLANATNYNYINPISISLAKAN